MLRVVASSGVLFLLAGCSPESWRWQRFTTLTEFGSFSGTDAKGAPFVGTLSGARRFDAERYAWEPIATPGASARFSVAPSGREFASTYGIYARERASGEWSLLSGSRALGIEFLSEDQAGHVYAQGPLRVGQRRALYVRLARSELWTEVDVGLSGYAFTDPFGAVYVTNDVHSQLVRVDGTTVVPLSSPSAIGFDFKGRRYQATVPFKVEVVDASGALTTWRAFFGVGTVEIAMLYGFGQDGRFYALAQSAPTGADFTAGDLISIGQEDQGWRLAASPVTNGDDTPGGLRSFADYGGSFARDGSMYFGACESGCTGSGNSFSYGLFRLTLGAQP